MSSGKEGREGEVKWMDGLAFKALVEDGKRGIRYLFAR
jgi:hypothetical protein